MKMQYLKLHNVQVEAHSLHLSGKLVGLLMWQQLLQVALEVK